MPGYKSVTQVTPYSFMRPSKGAVHGIGYKNYHEASGKSDTDPDRNLTITVYTGKFKHEQIVKMVNSKYNILKKMGFKGLQSVNVKYSTHWLPGKFTGFLPEDRASVPSMSDYDGVGDQDYYTQFSIAYIPLPPRQGGESDPSNNCLFNALQQAIPDLPWKTPESFKEFVGVNQRDKIDIKYLGNIENKLGNYRINLTGDHIRTSLKRAPYTVRLSIANGHYAVVPPLKTFKKTFKWESKKDPLDFSIYRYTDTTKKYVDAYFEGKYAHGVLTSVYFKSDMFHRIPQIKVNEQLLSLKESYDTFVNKANAIKKESNGQIDFYKIPSINDCAVDYFYRITGHAINTEPIEQDEAQWIDRASSGSIIYSKKEYSGPAYKYDYVSHYPCIMADPHSTFPVGRGEFSRMTTEEFDKATFLSIGIYRFRVFVEGKNSILFRKNIYHHYTQIDFALARKLGFKLEIIQDDEPNALIYSSKQWVKGHYLFGEYVKTLYSMKKKNIESAKFMLNVLWGALVEKNKSKVTFDAGKAFSIPENSSFKSAHHMENMSRVQVQTVDNAFQFKHDFARIKPFILARGRSKISTTILPCIDNLVFCHTDSMILSIKPDIVTGTNLGDLRSEGYCESFHVNSSGKCLGEFK